MFGVPNQDMNSRILFIIYNRTKRLNKEDEKKWQCFQTIFKKESLKLCKKP
jgi:hypothetical protein